MNEDMQHLINGVSLMLLVQRFEREWPEQWKEFLKTFEASGLKEFKHCEWDVPCLMGIVHEDIALVLYPPAKSMEDYLEVE